MPYPIRCWHRPALKQPTCRRLLALATMASALACSGVSAQGSGPLAALERRCGGRLGVVAVEAETGRRLVHRSDERFSLCSTFKLLLVGQILHRVDLGEETLARLVAYGAADLLDYAPITRQHLSAGGMTVAGLCAAALQYSDNTAANLLLRTQGGPAGLTRYLQALGDSLTRLDRIEPDLNTPASDRTWDTTSPAAMQSTLEKLLLGPALAPASRTQLTHWLLGNTTGGARLRAGLPPDWRVGEKTGTGDQGATHDVGILYPPTGPAIVLTAYLDGCTAPRASCEATLAAVAQVVVATMRPPPGVHQPSAGGRVESDRRPRNQD